MSGRRTQPRQDATEDPASDASSDDEGTRRKRARLPRLVSQLDVHGSPARSAEPPSATPDDTPDTAADRAPSPSAHRERSVSVTPPPELDDATLAFARDAVKRVFGTGPSPRVRDTDVAPSSEGDASFELNTDLARFYQGPDAARLRERALARQRSELCARQSAEPDVERGENGAGASQGANVQPITVDDSSDEEPVAVAAGPEAADTEPLAPETAGSAGDAGDLLSLTLRGAGGREVAVRVRPSTKIATMLAHFTRTYADTLDAQACEKAYVSFEGERLPPDTTVAEHDLEDEDMLEVMW